MVGGAKHMTEYNLKHPTQQKIKERMDKLQEWMKSKLSFRKSTRSRNIN